MYYDSFPSPIFASEVFISSLHRVSGFALLLYPSFGIHSCYPGGQLRIGAVEVNGRGLRPAVDLNRLLLLLMIIIIMVAS